MSFPRIVGCLVLVPVLLAGTALGASARQRVFVRSGAIVAELHSNPDRVGRLLQAWAVPSDVSQSSRRLLSMGSGRYLAWASGDRLAFFDTRLGTVVAGLTLAGSPTLIGTDSEGMRLVTASTDGASGTVTFTIVDGATLSARTMTTSSQCLRGLALAADADLMFVLRASSPCFVGPPDQQWVEIVELATGTTRPDTIPVSVGSSQHIAVNRTGTRVWISTALAGGQVSPGFEAYDVASASRLAYTTAIRPNLDATLESPMIVDDGRDRLLVVTPDGLVGLSGDTLQPLGSAGVPGLRPVMPLPVGYTYAFGFDVLAGAESDTVFAFERTGATYSYHGGPCLQSGLTALDADTYAVLGTIDLAEVAGVPICDMAVAMATPPAVPANFTAAVSGQAVTLSWDRPARTTHYEVEAGSAPGLRDLARLSPPSVPFVIDNVPSGTYYVRVRALNYAGKGAYTEDLTVVVP